MTTNLESASDKLSEWRSRLGEILPKDERQLINQFVSKANGGDDPALILTPELKAAIKIAKSDKKAVKLLKEAMRNFALADQDAAKEKLYPKESLNSFRRKAYSMLCGG